jgi:UDP-N-acetylmuramoylalanine--D-glutamate ligase
VTIDARHPLPGTRPLVAGAARSGIAAARLLRGHGMDVLVCDRAAAGARVETAAALEAIGARVAWGRDDPALLEDRDFVVWSPGLPVDHPLCAAAAARGIPVRSELEIGWLAARAPFVCVTGTNGKSTTTDLIGALVRAAGREVEVCGNIGRAVCEVAERVSPAGLLVVEVSSFQLETVDRLRPFVAVWLNLTPDHLDRHGSLEAYGALKQRLFARQTESDWAVWNADDPEVSRRRAGRAQALEISVRVPVAEGAFLRGGEIVLARRGGTETLMPVADLRLRGAHNHVNALAALAATLPLEIPPARLRETLATYRGLEHRLEDAGEVSGVTFVNDSKATNTASLAVALESFAAPVVLIAGGRDKSQDFTPLHRLARERVRTAVLMGEGAPRIAAAWPDVPAEHAATLAEAVDRAFQAARRGAEPRVVLLSPGCASFDMFTDYEDRGRRFKAEVARLSHEGARA